MVLLGGLGWVYLRGGGKTGRVRLQDRGLAGYRARLTCLSRA
jgi:hypothetical protein